MRIKLLFGIIVLLIVSVSVFLLNQPDEVNKEKYAELEEMEEEPNIDQADTFHPDELTPEEYKLYKKWKDDLEASGYNFRKLYSDKSNLKSYARYIYDPKVTETVSMKGSYVNDKLTGTWEQKHFEVTRSGHRVTGSAYDPVHDEIYAISSVGHLWKLDRNAINKWSLRNHKSSFAGDDLAGINLANGDFRLLHQQKNGGAEYSDDEGRTWNIANGALFENGWNHKTLVANYSEGKRVFAHGSNYSGSTGYHRIFISTDYGENYTQSAFSWSRSKFDVMICKPHNSNNVYAFARDKSTQKISIYRHTPEDTAFSLMQVTTRSFSALTRLYGTYVEGKYYFYVHANQENIFYSSNEGFSWTQTATDNKKQIHEIHPNKPNIAFKGFLTINMTEDSGTTWNSFTHNLGKYYIWDLRHMQVYEKSDGSDFLFAGLDFGCYISSTPEDTSTYEAINRGNPIVMCYDAVSSEIYNTGYTATQDKGCMGYMDELVDSTGLYNIKGVAGTDVLRVALANNEKSTWYWLYWGSIGHVYNTNPITKTGEKKAGIGGKWSATMLIESPDNNEDAVYIPKEPQLRKFHYNSSSGEIIRTYHHHTFPSKTTSFGYSSVNRNKWYVALDNKNFYYSTNAGVTFTKTSYTGTLPAQSGSYKKSRQVIKASKADENIVYFAGKGNVFLISKDGGKTFTNHVNGTTTDKFRDLDVTHDDKYVFAACGNDGPWVYSTEDDMWYSMESPATNAASYINVEYLASKNIVRFATLGGGVLDFHINEESPLPYKLIATASSENEIVLNWHYNSVEDDGFKVEKSTNGINYTELVTVDINTTEYSDTGLISGSTHYYRVKAYKDTTYTGYSNVASTITEFTLAIPDNVSANAISYSEIQLNWQDNSDMENGYKIEQSTNGSNFAQITIVDENVNSYTIDDLNASTTYYYRVRAFKGSNNSEYSDIISVTTEDNIINKVYNLVVTPKQKLLVLPNPAIDFINIVGLEEKQIVKIYTLSGSLVLTENTNKKIDISKLTSGVYVLKTANYEPAKFVIRK